MRIQATEEGLYSVKLFVAELLGYKGLSVEDKAAKGYEAYLNKTLHKLDLSKEEDRKELHENIWLERLYNEIEAYEDNKIMRALDSTVEPFKWSVPIELDFSASMLGILGLLLGDKRLLEMTNMSYTGKLNDPWQTKNMSRTLFKQPAMQMIYGSTKSASEIWKKNKTKFSIDDVMEFDKILKEGAFGLANDVKNFIIHYCNPEPVMFPKVWGCTYKIECNKHNKLGDYPIKFDMYNSETDTIKTITHMHTKKVPDLKSFKRFFVTNLIHHIDSRIADYICNKIYDKYEWVVDIHDAFLVSPEAASDVRKYAEEAMLDIYTNRKEIIVDYFRSIGIKGKEAKETWLAIMNKVKPIEDFKPSGWTLK